MKTYGLRHGEGQWQGAKANFKDKESLKGAIHAREDVNAKDKLLLSAERDDPLPMEWEQADLPERIPYVTVIHNSEQVTQLPLIDVVGGSTDGIRLQILTGMYSRRSSTASAILSLALLHRVLLIASPPMTGKTALLQLVHAMTKGSVRDSNGEDIWFEQASYTACTSCSESFSFAAAYEAWNESPFDQASLTPKRAPDGYRAVRLILADEVQHLYDEGKHAAFWRLVKDLQLDRGHGSIVLIMAAAYGSNPVRGLASDLLTTPVSLSSHQRVELRSASSLQSITVNLCKEEFDEWMSAFCSFHHLDFGQLRPLWDMIAMLTGCIPGTVHLILEIISEKFLSNFRSTLMEKGMELLESSGLYRQMSTRHRGFISEEAFEMLDPGLEALISDLLVRNGMLSAAEIATLPVEAQAAAKGLRKMGWLVCDGDWTALPPALHFQHMRFMFLTRRLEKPAMLQMTIDEFVIKLIGRFDAAQLQSSLNRRRGGNLQESAYHFEMYRAIMSLVPDNFILSPHVGAMLGARGFCDLVLMPVGWAFEPLREHSDIKGHAQRFQPGGNYFPMVQSQKIKSWVVLDFFGETTKQSFNFVDNVIYIQFTNDFTKANVIKAGTQQFIRVVGKATEF